jgi:hypothetical protein
MSPLLGAGSTDRRGSSTRRGGCKSSRHAAHEELKNGLRFTDAAAADCPDDLPAWRSLTRSSVSVLATGPAKYAAFAMPEDPTVRGGSWPTNRLPSSDVLGCVAERGAIEMTLLLMFGVLLSRGCDGSYVGNGKDAIGLDTTGYVDANATIHDRGIRTSWAEMGSTASSASKQPCRPPSSYVDGGRAASFEELDEKG